MCLTDGVSAEYGVRGQAGQTAAGGIDSANSELIHGALQQAGDVPVVTQRQRSDWVAGDTDPALGCGLLLLDDVAGDGGAAIVLGLVPVDGHRLQTDICYSRFLTLTRDSCKRTGHHYQYIIINISVHQIVMCY